MENKINMTDKEKVDLWKKRFFEAQAGMEKYLVEKYGYNELDNYIEYNAGVFKYLNTSENGASDLILRFAKQAECYNSYYSINIEAENKGEFIIFDCGIWSYRKESENNGVELTFDNPCTKYCAKLIGSVD